MLAIIERVSSLRRDQSGLIPMLLILLALVLAVIIFVFLRVKNAQ